MVVSGGMACGVDIATPRRQTRELEEIGKQGVAVLGGDALWVELHAVHGMGAVLQAHNQPAGFGRHRKVLGKALALHDQGVIARNLKPPGQSSEYTFARVADARELAVHWLRGAHDVAAVGLADGLMAEANAQDR